MKFTLVIAAFFIAGSFAGSPSEPKLCDIVAQISYEFSSFTASLLQMYILNLPRDNTFTSDDKSQKLILLGKAVDENPEVPEEDKKNFQKLVERNVELKAWNDQLTHANIWDCLVEIFTGALSGFWTRP
ncbi:unnamed protein product [Chironomus riparius]|uniref:Salivary secreted protein n=1 Tax=Chironomus riparius TaxID=315576 RepID=A0A9N9S482_9DIPT|nr:unnamed protein product [Chironomus riparius]